jgi:AraC-like DNA-binding protein
MTVSEEARQSPVSYLQLILRRFETNPVLRAQILSGVGLSVEEAEDPATQIIYTQLMRLFENMRDYFGEDWFVEIPELWRPTAHGALSLAALSAPTVGAAMEVLARYMPARFATIRIAALREPGAMVLRLTTIAPLSESLTRMLAELGMLAVSAGLDTLAGAPKAEMRFEFRAPRPTYADRLEPLLGAPVIWGAALNAAVLPERLLEMRSPLADAGLHEAAIERLEAARRSERAPAGVKGRVERLLAHSETGRAPAEVVAASLGLSRRTLMRRLADAGLSYRDLVDSELKSRAQRWLESGALSKAEISERLGFADVTGFSRAYRRWFKVDA